jgi:putative flippase GtrA
MYLIHEPPLTAVNLAVLITKPENYYLQNMYWTFHMQWRQDTLTINNFLARNYVLCLCLTYVQHHLRTSAVMHLVTSKGQRDLSNIIRVLLWQFINHVFLRFRQRQIVT